MKCPAYPKYKDSGVQWLGEVPEHWEVKKLGYTTSKIGSGKTPTGGATTYLDEGVMFLRSQNIYDDGLRLEDVVYIEETVDEEMENSRVQPLDILLNITGASLGRTCMVPDPFPRANVNQHVCIIRQGNKERSEFIAWMLKSAGIKAQVENAQTGAAREGLNFVQISKLLISLPPLPEQTAIADFLDRETGRIDTLVAKKRRLIALLGEKRTALISRTVTRSLPADAAREFGLEPHTRFKDSGIEWLGEVPGGWEVTPLFRIAETIQTGPFGSQLHSSDYVEGGIPLINPAHINASKVVPDELSSVDDATAIRLSRHRFRFGDIVMGRRGEIGRCAVIGATEVGWLCGTGSLVVRLRNSSAAYFASIISGAGFCSLLELNAVGTTMLNLTPTIVGRMLVPVPPHPEQTAIATYLDRETAKIDQLVAKVEVAIARLLEYRTALITAAVTGKIDVRGEGGQTGTNTDGSD